MFMKNSLYYFYAALIIVFFIFGTSRAQTLSGKLGMPKGLRLANHLEYSYDNKRDIEILENWFQLDYRKGIFFAGFRFETFQPNDPNPSISRGKNIFGDIDYKYAGIKIGSLKEYLKITTGSFYQLIGRGMILKSYEDRTIRVDNNLFGIKLNARYHNLSFIALSGSAANFNNERKDAVHAFDAEYKFSSFLSAGATFATNSPGNTSAARTTIMSARILPKFDNFDIYFEYGLKKNKDEKKAIGSKTFVGKGIYGNMNFYFGKLSFSGEYKYYDNFAFTSSDGTVTYNTPPSLRQDYSFTLMNRHPSPLDQNNEKGYQLALNYNPSEKDFLQVNYGITKTLPASSYYVTGNTVSQKQFEEVFGEWERDWNDSFFTLLGLGYNHELSSNTKNLTPVFEGRYYFNEINTLKITLEHQNTENLFNGENYFSDFAVIEYLRAPKLSIAIASEMKTTQVDVNRTIRKFWGFIRFGYKIGMHTDISLLVGSRQAGNICVGGVCRYEPEFSGVELKMLTRL